MNQRFLAASGGFLLTAGIVLVGCGGSSSPAAPTAGGGGGATAPTANVTVNIVGLTGSQAFNPNPVTATAGQTLAFRNSTGETHRIVQDGGGFDSGEIRPGQTSSLVATRGANAMTSSITVSSGGAMSFHCTIHPTMVGSVNGALPAPTGGGGSGGDGGGDTTGTGGSY